MGPTNMGIGWSKIYPGAPVCRSPYPGLLIRTQLQDPSCCCQLQRVSEKGLFFYPNRVFFFTRRISELYPFFTREQPAREPAVTKKATRNEPAIMPAFYPQRFLILLQSRFFCTSLPPVHDQFEVDRVMPRELKDRCQEQTENIEGQTRTNHTKVIPTIGQPSKKNKTGKRSEQAQPGTNSEATSRPDTEGVSQSTRRESLASLEPTIKHIYMYKHAAKHHICILHTGPPPSKIPNTMPTTIINRFQPRMSFQDGTPCNYNAKWDSQLPAGAQPRVCKQRGQGPTCRLKSKGAFTNSGEPIWKLQICRHTGAKIQGCVFSAGTRGAKIQGGANLQAQGV